MLLVLGFFVAAVVVVTVRDIVRRRDLRVGRRVAWTIAAILLPLFAIPIYWLVRPLRPSSPPRSTAPRRQAQTLADLIPGWSPDAPGACEQASAWASSASHVSPEPSFYGWLRESGLAERHPACATRLVRALLGSEHRPTFAACPEIGALMGVLEQCGPDEADLGAIREQLRRLCPEPPNAGRGGASGSLHPALG